VCGEILPLEVLLGLLETVKDQQSDALFRLVKFIYYLGSVEASLTGLPLRTTFGSTSVIIAGSIESSDAQIVFKKPSRISSDLCVIIFDRTGFFHAGSSKRW
jgi:hypothetical protein